MKKYLNAFYLTHFVLIGYGILMSYIFLLYVTEFFVAWYSGAPYELYATVPRYFQYLGAWQQLLLVLYGLSIIMQFLAIFLIPALLKRKKWAYWAWILMLLYVATLECLSWLLDGMRLFIHDVNFQTTTFFIPYYFLLFLFFCYPSIKGQFTAKH
jgi:hypothetical protein